MSDNLPAGYTEPEVVAVCASCGHEYDRDDTVIFDDDLLVFFCDLNCKADHYDIPTELIA